MDSRMDGGGQTEGSEPVVLRMNSQRTRSGLPPAYEQQLTPAEVEALSSMRQKVVSIRFVGSCIASIATLSFLRYRKQNIFQLASMGKIVFGGFVGGILTVPFALASSSREIMKVEDPKHLAHVLTQAQRGQRGPVSPPQPGVSPGRYQQQPQQQQPRSSGRPVRGQNSKTNQYGDDMGQSEMSYSNDFANAPSVDQYTMPVADNSSYGTQHMPSSDGSNDGANQQSRWAQLRSQRGVQESSWEKIREENARKTYNQQSSRGQGQLDQNAFGRDSFNQSGSSTAALNDNRERNGGLADPDFGKGVSTTRMQAQRDYERSFEREKRGIDG